MSAQSFNFDYIGSGKETFFPLVGPGFSELSVDGILADYSEQRWRRIEWVVSWFKDMTLSRFRFRRPERLGLFLQLIVTWQV